MPGRVSGVNIRHSKSRYKLLGAVESPPNIINSTGNQLCLLKSKCLPAGHKSVDVRKDQRAALIYPQRVRLQMWTEPFTRGAI